MRRIVQRSMEYVSTPAPGEMREGERDALPALRIGYENGEPAALLSQRDVLAVIGFGTSSSSADGFIAVGLDPLAQPAPFEVWRGHGGVTRGCDGEIHWSADEDYTVGLLEIDEAAAGGLAAAAQQAYTALARWLQSTPTRHLLRIWNYLDAINDGAGDAERYRQFCAGRAAGMDGAFDGTYPAATAIGRRDGRRVLQLYWLAARQPGMPLENPRQTSSWRYPREYGPRAPIFARAMRAPVGEAQTYISGTAAIVGHLSHHRDDCMAQLDETLANIDSLIAGAAGAAPALFGSRSALKAYVRHAADAPRIAARLRERFGAEVPLLLLHGDICRAELLLEIDGVHRAQ